LTFLAVNYVINCKFLQLTLTHYWQHAVTKLAAVVLTGGLLTWSIIMALGWDSIKSYAHPCPVTLLC